MKKILVSLSLLIVLLLFAPFVLFSAINPVKTAKVLGNSITPLAYIVDLEGYDNIVFVGFRWESREKEEVVTQYKRRNIIDLTEIEGDFLSLQLYYKKYGKDILVLVDIANDRADIDGAYSKLARIDPKTCRIKWSVQLPMFGVSFPGIEKGVAYVNSGGIKGTVNVATGKWIDKTPK